MGRVLLGLDLHLGAKAHAREVPKHDVAELGLGEQEEVVSPRRQTVSGAITRAFGVRSSASHDSCETSLETMRWRKSSASGPRTPTYARGRMATPSIWLV